jgi:hypothetical protein
MLAATVPNFVIATEEMISGENMFLFLFLTSFIVLLWVIKKGDNITGRAAKTEYLHMFIFTLL